MALLAVNGALEAGEKAAGLDVSVTVRPGFRIQSVVPNAIAVRATAPMTYAVSCGEHDAPVAQGTLGALSDPIATRVGQVLKLENYPLAARQACTLTLYW